MIIFSFYICLCCIKYNIKQNGEEKIRFTSCFTDFSKSKGDNLREVEAPKFAPIEDCIDMPYIEGFTPVLEKQIERKFTPNSNWWDQERPRDRACLDAYYSWPGGEDVDLFSIIFFLDTMSPPVFNRLGSRGWVPSIEAMLESATALKDESK